MFSPGFIIILFSASIFPSFPIRSLPVIFTSFPALILSFPSLIILLPFEVELSVDFFEEEYETPLYCFEELFVDSSLCPSKIFTFFPAERFISSSAKI